MTDAEVKAYVMGGSEKEQKDDDEQHGVYTCVICAEHTPSTHEEPMAVLVSAMPSNGMQSTSINITVIIVLPHMFCEGEQQYDVCAAATEADNKYQIENKRATSTSSS